MILRNRGGVSTVPLSHVTDSFHQVNPVKRITIDGIREHDWFKVDLPPHLFPLPGTPSSEVLAAIRCAQHYHTTRVCMYIILSDYVVP